MIGIDFSHGFINAANKLKTYGKLPYTVQTEGSLVSKHVAAVDPDIVSRDVYKALNYKNKKNSNNNKCKEDHQQWMWWSSLQSLISSIHGSSNPEIYRFITLTWKIIILNGY